MTTTNSSQDDLGASAGGAVYAAAVSYLARPRSHRQCHLSQTTGGSQCKDAFGW